MVVRRKGQGAMEFIMAYGWAIIAVIITIAGLAYFGVLNPSAFIPESCTMFPGIACNDFYANNVEVTIKVKNGGGKTFNTFSIGIPGCLTGNALNGLSDGELESIVIPGCSFVNEKVIRKDLQITYSDQGVSHTKSGKITTVVNNNYIRNGGMESDSGIQYSNNGDSTAGNLVPDGWIRAGLAAALDTSNFHSETYSQRYTQPSGQQDSCTPGVACNVFRQPIIPVVSGDYKLTFWATKSTIGGRLIGRVDDVDGAGVLYSTLVTSSPLLVSQGSWTQYTVNFNVPVTSHGYVTLYIYTGGSLGCPCTMYLDDVKIEKV